MTLQHTNDGNSKSNNEKPAPEARKAAGQSNSGASERVRFNWGFHDGAADAAAGRLPIWHGTTHYDGVYSGAYGMGREVFEATGLRPESSSDAWGIYAASMLAGSIA